MLEEELRLMAKDLRVLYVEDESMTRMIMTRHLQDFFSQVTTATNGREGLSLYKEGEFHIVLSDILMPVIDGLEMVKQIKEQNREQQIILISAHDDAENLLKAIELEINCYLIKPVYRERLIKALYQIVMSIHQNKKIQEAEKALQESEKRYRTLVDNLPIGVYRKEAGEEGSFVMVNPALARMLGYENGEDLIGRTFKELLCPEVEKSSIPDELLQREVCLTKKEGPPLWALVSSRRVKRTSGGRAFYDGTIEDITHRKEAENRLASYMAEIERKNLALEKAHQKIYEDLNKARLIHQQLLPGSFPQLPGISLAAYYQPAENIGGDFYHMHLLEDQILFYITDVTGHGLDGAILSVFVRETVNSYMNIDHPKIELSPASLLRFISSRYCQENFPYDYFICMLIGIYELKTGLFSYVNAGIQVGPYVATDTDLSSLSRGGPPISAVFGTDLLDFTTLSISLKEGDSILLVTDGVVEESIGGEMYGEDRLTETFFANRKGSPQSILDSITKSLTSFCGNTQIKDDITLFILKREQAHS